MAILWNPKVRRLLTRYPFLRKQWFTILMALLLVGLTGYVFLGEGVFMHYLGKSEKEVLLSQLGDEFEGTFRQKYLKKLPASELWSESFYDKWNLISHLDELVDEPIEELKYKDDNIENLFTLMENYQTNDELKRKFNDLTLSEKIRVYAEDLLPQSNYIFRPIRDEIYKDVYNPTRFMNSRLKKWAKIKDLLDEKDLVALDINDETFQKFIEDLRSRKIKHNNDSAAKVKNALDHIKTFGSLFLKSSTPLDSNSDQLCSLVQEKLFPWLSGKLPIFESFNLKSNKVEHEKFSSSSSCFIKGLQTGLEGKGIVITAHDYLVPELSGLISLLKLTGNKYPVQIIHKGDLTQANIKHLVKVASDPVMKLPKSWDSKKYPMSKITTFDLTFVDVSRVLDARYKTYFNGFGMKLLAMLFNSFEEMIMLDTDTIPLLPINEYFERERYLNSQTLFFRDREANSFLYDGVVDFFKSFLNSDYESHFLGLNKASEETLNNRFFGDMARHFMESGLFVINKSNKFDGLLVSVVLQFFNLFTGSLHGEKELIWLGQEYMSNQYSFNKHGAVAVGELSTGREDLGLKSHELCSTHPGHLADDGITLLWFNSGFLTCKKPQSYFKDVNYAKNKGKSLQELKVEYLSPLKISNALIPPPAEYFSTSFAKVNSLESNQIIDPELNAEITPQQLFDTEPSRSWIMTPHCSNYLWCAYDIIQGGQSGTVVNFKPESTELWEFWGETWVGYFKGARTTGGDLGYFEDKYKDELDFDESEDESNEHDFVDEAKKAVLGETHKKLKSASEDKLLTKNGSGNVDKHANILDDDEEEEGNVNSGSRVVDETMEDLEQDSKEYKKEDQGQGEFEDGDEASNVAGKKSGAHKLSEFSKFKNKGKSN